MSGISLLYATAPDLETAKKIARALVEGRLAACVNVIPASIATYRWQGAIEEASECVLIAKTTAASAAAARDQIAALHPYETPAILSLPVDEKTSSGPFCAWIENETR